MVVCQEAKHICKSKKVPSMVSHKKHSYYPSLKIAWVIYSKNMFNCIPHSLQKLGPSSGQTGHVIGRIFHGKHQILFTGDLHPEKMARVGIGGM
jgi:hypothetical protein